MREIERLRRERYKKMLNMLPEIIADKQAPSFFYYNQQRYIDWDKINLDHIQVRAPQRNEVEKTKKIQTEENQQVALNILGNRKLLKVDDISNLHLQGLTEKIEGNPIQFQPYSLQRAALYDKGCITCGKANIIVLYHKDRHICLDCRQKVTTLTGDPVVIFQDDDSQVIVLGVSDSDQLGNKVYQVSPDQLQIFGYKCYVSFSAPDDLIVLLHDRLNEHKRIKTSRPNQNQNQIYQWESYQSRKNFKIQQIQDIEMIIRNKKAVDKNFQQSTVSNFNFRSRQTFTSEQTEKSAVHVKKNNFMGRSSSSMTSIKKKMVPANFSRKPTDF